MLSLRTKLITLVIVITVSSLAAVVVSNLQIIRSDKEHAIKRANQQISELVSRTLVSQIDQYRKNLEFLFRAWKESPENEVNGELFPDYVWIQITDWQGQVLYEWENFERLEEKGIISARLLGKLNQADLVGEVKQFHSEKDQWVLFNSTIEPFFPTMLLVSGLIPEGSEDPEYIILAEISSETLYSKVHSRRGQELMLLDSHQNVLLSTKPGWDPSDLVFLDESALGVIRDLDMGQQFMNTITYEDSEDQLTWIHKLQTGHGITMFLQEPMSSVLAGQRRMGYRSIIIGVVVLIIALNFAVFLSMQMVSPLNKLQTLVEQAGKGKFSGRIKVNSKDEIGKLAKLFNKMLTDLADRDSEVERAKQKLIQSEKMSAFGQMSAGIAHEVKNPLAGILGYSQMAKKKLADNPEIVNYLDIIEKETTRCKEIVDNLMKFARQEKANLSKVDINKTVQDSIRLVEHQISVSGIQIVQIYAIEGGAIPIAGNSNQIQQVMLNLMLNAQQAMESKGTLNVSTHLDEKRKLVLIMVSDTGSGMPEDVKERIFEPFFTTKGVGKGTGLGLAVTMGIIKDHKGNITVDSAPGKGTTFTISLPLASTDEEGEGEGENSEKKEGTAAA